MSNRVNSRLVPLVTSVLEPELRAGDSPAGSGKQDMVYIAPPV